MSGIEDVIQRSLQELGAKVVPRSEVFMGKRRDDKKQSGTVLPEDAIRVMECILRKPHLTIEERAAELEMDRQREWRARRKLEVLGLLEPARKVGKTRFFAPSTKGKEWAVARGIKIRKFKSGWFHQAVLLRVIFLWRRAVRGIRFKQGGPINAAQPDGLVMTEYGTRIPVQVCVSNTAEREARALLRLAEEPLVDRVLMVAVGKGKAALIQKRVEELVQGQDQCAWKEVGKKVLVEDVETVFRSGFDWKGLMGDRG